MLDSGAAPHPATAVLRPLRFPRLGAFAGKVMAWGYRLTGKARYDDFRLECIQGAHFIVLPSVFNPKVPRTGEFLASCLDSSLVSAAAEVLDMGTGSGVCAVFAARYARRVVAVDINPAAVRCATLNVLMNQLEHKIEVRRGDLFGPVATERFDLILFNPPFVHGTPRDDRDRAWRATDVVERFAAGLRGHLKPGAAALVLLSTFGDAPVFLEEFRKQALDVVLLAERAFVNERLALFRLKPLPAGQQGQECAVE
ncbi:MAG: methylase [Gammaproteobacteria bacterium]|jgi:release factor glutamine methyltransferase|nr:methylase [Gammaproteobacteria bacterium]